MSDAPESLIITLLKFGVPSILSFIGGSLLTPWGTWILETKRARRQAKQQLIADVKKKLFEMSEAGYSSQDFSRTDEYARIREFLPQKITTYLDMARTDRAIHVTVNLPNPTNRIRYSFFEDMYIQLASLEKEWGLI